MPIKVLIVDDSGFFRRRLTEIINSGNEFQVVGSACNGREAIEKTQELHPDVITMDYEMPIMDGISAVKLIMDSCPTPILMFSSLTFEGARVTLDALEAGAVDFLPKTFEDISRNPEKLKLVLQDRLRAISRSNRLAVEPTPTLRTTRTDRVATETQPKEPAPRSSTLAEREPPRTPRKAAPLQTSPRNQSAPATSRSAALDTASRSASTATAGAAASGATAAPAAGAKQVRKRSRPFRLVAIGTSTGGPLALQKVLAALPANFPVPLVIVQHMPGTFTKAFAERLDSLSNIRVKEAASGDRLEPGVALLAPGGKQMMVDKTGKSVKVLEGDERLNYKPSVDVTFGSAANAFGGDVLGVIMTGMGADGCEGSRLLKQKGSTIWSQDQKSCVIYGMPMAVAQANLTDAVLSLDEIGPTISREF